MTWVKGIFFLSWCSLVVREVVSVIPAAEYSQQLDGPETNVDGQDFTIITWDPTLQDGGVNLANGDYPTGSGRSFFKVMHDPSTFETAFWLIPNANFILWVLRLTRDGSLIPRDFEQRDITICVMEDEEDGSARLIDDLLPRVIDEAAIAVKIKQNQYLYVESAFDVSGYMVLQSAVLGENKLGIPLIFDVEFNVTDGTGLTVIAGNTGTAVADPSADYSLLVAGDFSHHVYPHSLWTQPDRFLLPSIPGARAFYIKLACQLPYFPPFNSPDFGWTEADEKIDVTVNYVNGLGEKVTDTYTLYSVIDTVLAYVPENVPVHLISASTYPITVAVFAESGLQGRDSLSVSPLFLAIPPVTFYQPVYQVTTINTPGLNHWLTFIVDADHYNEVMSLNANAGTDSNVGPNWEQIMDTNYYTLSYQPPPGDQYMFMIRSDSTVPFGIFQFITSDPDTGSGFFATGDMVAVLEFSNGQVVEYTPVEPPASTPAPTPSTPAPTPSTPAPTPSTPAPTPSTPAPTPSTPAPTPSTPAPSVPTPSPPTPPPTTPSPTTPSIAPTTPSTPPPTIPPIPGCPCVRFDGIQFVDSRYSNLNGIYVQQKEMFNDRPVYQHVGCSWFLYFWQGEVSYWTLGPEVGSKRGVLVNWDTSNSAASLNMPWRAYMVASGQWDDVPTVTASCDCNGIVRCRNVRVQTMGDQFPGTFSLVDVHNGRATYLNNYSGMYLYYNVGSGNCERWVIGAEPGLKSTRAYVYDNAFEPVDIQSSVRVRSAQFTFNLDYYAGFSCVN